MRIKLIHPIHPTINQIKDQFNECLSNGLVTNNSKYVNLFEKNLKGYLKTKTKPLVFCNGELALFNLIQAWKDYLDLSPHDSFKVIVPSFTFTGTINAIVASNGHPIFCDIDETMTINIKSIDNINSDVKMLIAVGAYGTLPDLESIINFCDINNLVFILDGAPSFGAKYNNNYSSKYKLSEIWSFHATKVLSSMEGGAAFSYNNKIVQKLKYLRNFGQKELIRGEIDSPGLNSKMQEISAIVGLYNLENFKKTLEKRNILISKYNKMFNELVARENIKLMKIKDNTTCNYTNYPIILNEDATQFVKYMESNNIQVRRYYTAAHSLKYYKHKYYEYNLDYTNFIKDKIVALPLHSGIFDDELEYLFETVKNYFLRKKV